MADVYVWIHRGPNVGNSYRTYADEAISHLDNQLSVSISGTELGEVPNWVTDCSDQADSLSNYEQWVENNYTTYDHEHYMLIMRCDLGDDIGAGGGSHNVSEPGPREYFNSQAAVSVVNQGIDGFLDYASTYNGVAGFKATVIHELCHSLSHSNTTLSNCSSTGESNEVDEHACGEVDSSQACSPMLFWYSNNSHNIASVVGNYNAQKKYVNCIDSGDDSSVKQSLSSCFAKAVEDYVNNEV